MLQHVKTRQQCYLYLQVSQLSLLPQGKPESKERVQRMVDQMDLKDLATAQIQELVRLSALRESA